MSRQYILIIQKAIFGVAMLVLLLRVAGLFDASIINIVSNWLIGRSLIVPSLESSSFLAGFEESWLSLIDGMDWSAVVLFVGAIALFALPPAAEPEHKIDHGN